MNSKILLAAALLGVSTGAHAEQTTQIFYPYAVPFAYAPVAPVQLEVNEELVKAYVDYQRKAYEHFLSYQQQARENTPAILRIPAVPPVPALDAARLQELPTTRERMPQQFLTEPSEVFQPELMTPDADIEQRIAEREQQLEAALAAAQKRLDERQNDLDVIAGRAKTL